MSANSVTIHNYIFVYV